MSAEGALNRLGRELAVLCRCVAIAVFGHSVDALGQTQYCSKVSTSPVKWLDQALEALKQEHPMLVFKPEDDVCSNLQFTQQLLAETLRRRYLKGVNSYAFARVSADGVHFTVEYIGVSDQRNVDELIRAVVMKGYPRLASEANLTYVLFRVNGGLLFMVAPASERLESMKLFQELHENLAKRAKR